MAGKCPVFKAFVLEMPILSVFQRFLASRKVSEKSGWFHYRVAGSGLSPKLKIKRETVPVRVRPAAVSIPGRSPESYCFQALPGFFVFGERRKKGRADAVS